jgi:hypothetical protein
MFLQNSRCQLTELAAEAHPSSILLVIGVVEAVPSSSTRKRRALFKKGRTCHNHHYQRLEIADQKGLRAAYLPDHTKSDVTWTQLKLKYPATPSGGWRWVLILRQDKGVCRQIYRPGGDRVRIDNIDWSPMRWTSLAPLKTSPQPSPLFTLSNPSGWSSQICPHHTPPRTQSSPAFRRESVGPVSSLRWPGCCGSRTRPMSPRPRSPRSKSRIRRYSVARDILRSLIGE